MPDFNRGRAFIALAAQLKTVMQHHYCHWVTHHEEGNNVLLAEELNIQIKRISPERDTEAFEAIQESLDNLLQVGMFYPEFTLDEFIEFSKNVVEAWDKRRNIFIPNH